MRPVLAISIGDVYGIGPEIILKGLTRGELGTRCRPIVVGSAAALEWHRRHFGITLPLYPITMPAEATDGVVNVIDTGGDFDPSLLGRAHGSGGAIALAAIERSVELCLRGEAAALVTAPVSKEALALAGAHHPGHTEILADLTESSHVAMIMHAPALRVILTTIHLPLSEVAARVTRESVERTIEIGQHALVKDFGIPRPLLSVLALNPHGGDNGLLGPEDGERIAPAVAACRARGIQVDGPHPADGFFSAHHREYPDMVVAMYHDQGLIPFKLLAQGRGVNVTAGLPIVRTSPDHGTAFALAGLGRASYDSFVEAADLALRIARERGRVFL